MKKNKIKLTKEQFIREVEAECIMFKDRRFGSQGRWVCNITPSILYDWIIGSLEKEGK